MTWDINRDTDQRMGYIQGDNNLYQTGQGRGKYLNEISKTLNCEELPRPKRVQEKRPRNLPPLRSYHQSDKPRARLHVAKPKAASRQIPTKVETTTAKPRKQISDKVFDSYAENIFKAWNLWSK